MTFDRERSGQGRRKDEVTVAQIKGWALKILLGVFVGGLLAAWNLSAQVSDLRRDVQEAQSLGPLVVSLTNEVRLLRKGQDSLVTLMTDREKRDPDTRNPLVNR